MTSTFRPAPAESEPRALLRALCLDGAARAAGTPLREELADVAATLDAPLQLAVAGAVSSGKSTLINALLGRPVAAVDAGECTRIVTWYEHGDDGEVLVDTTDGAVHATRLQDGRVPERLPVPVEQVRRLRVRLDEPWLRSVTLIDTPGLDTVAPAGEQATRRLLFGDDGADVVQALIYVFRQVRRFDARTLESFRELTSACGLTAVDTSAVLTQVDRLDEADPWPVAARLAATAEAGLRGSVLDVVPVVGLLAETGRGAFFGPDEMAALRALAALPPVVVDDLLLDLDEFVSGEDGAGSAVRRELVRRLHRYGIREATALLRARPDATPDALHAYLVERSGFGDAAARPGAGPATLAQVVGRFIRYGDGIKTMAAMGRIARIGRRPHHPGDEDLLRELTDAVGPDRPLAAGLGELRLPAAMAEVGRGRLPLDDVMVAELTTLVRGDDPASRLGLPPDASVSDVAAAAREASVRWRHVRTLAGESVGGRRAADVLAALEEMAGAAAPVVPVTDRPLIEPLLTEPTLTVADRDLLHALLTAGSPQDALALPAGAPPDVLRAAAVDAVDRLRALLHRPLDRPTRRGVRAAADAAESIVVGLAAGRPS